MSMALKPLIDEKLLLKKTALGDQHAFTEIYNHHYPEIYGFARHLLNSDELALDVVQESMLHIWQQGDKLNSIYNLHGYLKTFAQRRAIDILRNRDTHRKAEKILAGSWQETHNETEEGILLNEGRRILEDGIRQLPKQQQLVYRLCQQQGLKYEEAAAQLNISSGTVKTHLKVAMRSLRSYISEHSDIVALVVIFKLI
ncbi:RNA polymerase ECF-type sigma factor [Pedobacter sp. BAL39]|uniref:RNA polymerase sigma factor n=1 Tax=Pedobacter sp. BAL39 TaxID=391596 RepID=UPI0001559F62|nr:sigma-70 family RNA polymerase sigma factor [Pedobacter sp. BAL39]EDM35540.1 RNA polymerase ECF-type sigma factor [Pedobacter sp. BAL39]